MKTTIRLFATLTLAAIGAFVASDAEAAFSGTVRRAVCPRGTFRPLAGSESYFSEYGGCTIQETDFSSPPPFRYGTIGIPVESSGGTTVTGYVRAVRDNSSSDVCAQLLTYTTTGSLSDYSNAPCISSGSYDLNLSSTDLPANGALFISVGMKSVSVLSDGTQTYIDYASVTWTANGT
jgi:hypothetical protein